MFMIHRKITLTTLFLLTVLAQAHATTVPYKNFDNLVDEAEHVVLGTISEMNVKKQKGEIYTVITLKQASTIGSTGQTKTKKPIQIRYKGGALYQHGRNGQIIGVEGSMADGTPELSVGDRVILFISNNGIADMPIHGWGQGVFHIDEAEGVNDVDRTPVVGIDGANIVLKAQNGLLINGRSVITKTLSNAATPVLLDSDGGADTLVTGEKETESANNKLASYSAMHVSNFVSMIQERKAMKTDRLMSSTESTSSLFTLPDITERNADASMTGRSVKMTSTMEVDAIDTTPVKPLSRPESMKTGE